MAFEIWATITHCEAFLLILLSQILVIYIWIKPGLT